MPTQILGYFLTFILLIFNASLQAAESKQVATQIPILLQKEKLTELSPSETVNLFYYLVLANSIINNNADNMPVTKVFFTKDLADLYDKQRLVDDKYVKANGEIRCIDYNLLLGAQDIPYSFRVTGEKLVKHSAMVNVIMNYLESVPLTLQLNKTNLGWKITNIMYPSTHESIRSELERCVKMEASSVSKK